MFVGELYRYYIVSLIPIFMMLYSVSLTLLTTGPFGKMDTLSFHIAFSLLFNLSLIVYHWYSPSPPDPGRRGTTGWESQEVNGTNIKKDDNSNKPTLTNDVNSYQHNFTMSPTVDATSPNGGRPKHYPEITPMDSFNITTMPKVSDVDVWSGTANSHNPRLPV